jgi:hypothetical protein
MGKSCVRFKTAEALALDVIGQAVARTPVKDFVERYEATRGRPLTSHRHRAADRSSGSRCSQVEM